ncbi:hypothetical protein CMI37_06475 [Candidatus Pacearchaeota archaeon]|jgi:hypothetical protein|nr:hypothetical protein [Candidatus Pacearchaeota archaeon]|tara:strand:- start:1650 stop:2327 length:678 start_codon:yes stop_codon:yes gene_type:complete
MSKKIPLKQNKSSDESVSGFSLTSEKPVNFPAKRVKGSKKKTKILPSHRLIFKHYEENGFRNLSKAIRKTRAFSESTANHVSTITKSKSWQALMDQKMPEEHLATRHKELLDKRDVRRETDEFGAVTEVDEGPNTAAVTKGLEMAYKLRGSYKEQEKEAPQTVMYNLFYKPEVRAQMKEFEEGLKKSLVNEIAKKNQKELDEESIRDAEFTEDSEQSENGGSGEA